MYYLA
ncbi:16e175b7-c47c-4ba3-a2b5-ec7406317e3a [Thermothielavioides terrestris]